jgi:hypothetical protein
LSYPLYRPDAALEIWNRAAREVRVAAPQVLSTVVTFQRPRMHHVLQPVIARFTNPA